MFIPHADTTRKSKIESFQKIGIETVKEQQCNTTHHTICIQHKGGELMEDNIIQC